VISTLLNEGAANIYIRKGYWRPETLADLCDRNAKDWPQKEAVADSNTRLTWSQVKRESDRLALGFLEMGLKKDDVILTVLPNSVDLFLLFFAFEKAGIIMVGIPPTFRRAEIEPVAQQTGAIGAVVCWQFRGFDYYQMIRDIQRDLSSLRYIWVSGEAVPKGAISLDEIKQKAVEQKYSEPFFKDTKITPFEICRFATTSGSTGAPKLMESVFCAHLLTSKVWAQRVGFTHEDVVGALYSIVGGGSWTLSKGVAPLFGAKVALLEHFSPQGACELIEKERVTVLAGVPAAFAKILMYPDLDKYDLSSLRLVYNSTSLLPYEIALALEEKFMCSVVQSYGAMDAGPITCTSVYDSRDVRLRTVGKPYDYNELRLGNEKGEEVAVGEIGEVMVRGAHLAERYYRNPELMKKKWINGWFKVGDLGRFDGQGNLTLLGRKDNLIIRGGRNIAPEEIEDLLVQHPKVAEAVVVRMPDPVMGEKACACVVLKPGESIAFEEILSFLRGKDLAPFKLPERIEILGKLPMVAAGQKVDRKQLERYVVQKLDSGGRSPSV
jgi:non-ribosomal peptide synthetase component E (peptide arylation enzyme)